MRIDDAVVRDGESSIGNGVAAAVVAGRPARGPDAIAQVTDCSRGEAAVLFAGSQHVEAFAAVRQARLWRASAHVDLVFCRVVVAVDAVRAVEAALRSVVEGR